MGIFSVVRALKDEIAIVLSVFALTMSGVSLYYQVRETDAVSLRLVEIDSTTEKSERAVVQFVISNAGNLPYLISEIKMVVSSSPDGKGYGYPSDGSTSAKGTPFVLDKGQMKLVEVDIPVAQIVGGGKKAIPAYLGAVVTSADVNGEVHRVELWYAALCVQSGMLVNGINSGKKFPLKESDYSLFKRSDLNQCL